MPFNAFCPATPDRYASVWNTFSVFWLNVVIVERESAYERPTRATPECRNSERRAVALEIVSPESQTRDRVHKFAGYEAGGVPEYWLLDSARRTADFCRRGRTGKAAGKYKPVPPDKAGVYRSKAVPGFWPKSTGSGSSPCRPRPRC